MAGQIRVILFVLLCFFPRSCRCNVADNDNTLYAAPLCAIVSLARTPPTLPTDDKDPTIVAQKILNLNMTLSPPKWRSMFEHSTKKKTFPESPEKPDSVPQEWHSRWESWAKQAEAVHDQQTAQALLEEFNLGKTTDNEKAVVLMLLRPYATTAQYVLNSLEQIKTDESSPSADELKAELHTAVYGEATDNEAALGTKKLFQTTPSGNRQGMCDGSTRNSKATTVASWLMCLCATQSSSGLTKSCGRQHTVSGNWDNMGSDTQTAWDGVKALCPKQYTGDITAAAVTSLITAVTSKLTSLASKTVYGTLHSGACNGQNSGVLCFSFNDVHSSADKNLNEFGWISRLRVLATKLRKRENGIQQKKTLYTMIKAAETQTHEISTTLQTTPKPQIATTTVATGPTNVAKKQIDCSVHTNRTACDTAAVCTWAPQTGKSETDGTCKPKSGTTETNAAGTGETAAPAKEEGKKCPEKTKQEECKDGCKWENNACKDSSILVNKQFALMVSAAFAALLFLS